MRLDLTFGWFTFCSWCSCLRSANLIGCLQYPFSLLVYPDPLVLLGPEQYDDAAEQDESTWESCHRCKQDDFLTYINVHVLWCLMMFVCLSICLFRGTFSQYHELWNSWSNLFVSPTGHWLTNSWNQCLAVGRWLWLWPRSRLSYTKGLESRIVCAIFPKKECSKLQQGMYGLSPCTSPVCCLWSWQTSTKSLAKKTPRISASKVYAWPFLGFLENSKCIGWLMGHFALETMGFDHQRLVYPAICPTLGSKWMLPESWSDSWVENSFDDFSRLFLEGWKSDDPAEELQELAPVDDLTEHFSFLVMSHKKSRINSPNLF